MSELHTMKLHDILFPDKKEQNISILCVPGGWIYTIHGDFTGGYIPSSVFVPFDTEFKQRD